MTATKCCPYCGKECKHRGLYNHVANSKGNGHGPVREVPDDFYTDEVPFEQPPVNRDESISTTFQLDKSPRGRGFTSDDPAADRSRREGDDS